MVNEVAIELENLTKRFGTFLAVDKLNLKIQKGEIFGILGPNGAGKTTSISMILGLVKPTSGKIKINGLDTEKNINKIKQIISLMAQETIVDGDLSAYRNLFITARLYHLPKEKISNAIKNGLEISELVDFSNKKASSFSGGMKRRLYLAKCLLNNPSILILDEPTTGLDVQNRNKLWQSIQALQKKGVTVILTTQYLEEADKLCNRIAIIDHGKIIALGTPSELKRMVSKGQFLELILSKDNIQKASKILLSKFKISTEFSDDKLKGIVGNEAVSLIPNIIKELEKNNINVLALSLHLPTMDDVFLKLTGSSLRDTKDENNLKNKIKK
ncbi:MAG: ATP-binding cassette domain-containing protein [Candidatus Micrarchaeaceae archaeon]